MALQGPLWDLIEVPSGTVGGAIRGGERAPLRAAVRVFSPLTGDSLKRQSGNHIRPVSIYGALR